MIRGSATRGCSGGSGPDELASRSESERCGQGASPRSICVIFWAAGPKAHCKPSQHACMFRGYLRVNHRTSVLSALRSFEKSKQVTVLQCHDVSDTRP